MIKDFKYVNINPQKNVEEDCVCRAISMASGLPYRVVDKLLELTARANDSEKLCVCSYHTLLEDVFGYRVKFPTYITVGELASLYPNNVLIVRIDGHLTACMYGVCVDIWDCTEEIVDCYWIV